MKQKVAIVTGSAQGIGKAIALKLAQNDYCLCLIDNQTDRNSTTCSEINKISEHVSYAYTCDIGNREEVEKVFDDIKKHFDHVDVLINNAAIFTTESIAKDDINKIVENYHKNIDTNFFGTLLCSSLVVPLMIKQNKGTIININTNHIKRNLFNVSRSEHCYDASKYAQLSLTQSMARELKDYGIRVNAICPASTRTPMLEGYFDPSLLPLTKETILKATHYYSLLEPEEVANAVLGMINWGDNQPVGNAYLLMYSEDCQDLAKGHVERLSKGVLEK